MKITGALRHRLAWANVPATLLVALLQRMPLLRIAATAEEDMIAPAAGGVLRSAVAAAASLGTLHTLVGASGTIEADPSGLLAVAGQPTTGVAFDVPGAQNISSWVVGAGSMIPPGMNLSGGAGSTPVLTGPGTLNVDFQVAVLTGTPTVPGSYTFFLTAWDGPNGAGDFSTDELAYTLVVGGSRQLAPAFTLAASPATANIATGRTVVFNAIATGTPAPQYQWTLNGSPTIPGASVTNDPILVITGATAVDNGTITCTASNTIGSPATSSATLAVAPASTPGYITNLSGRGLVGSGPQNALFGGFGISGSGTKQLLIRGMGPSLLPGPPYFFNVADALTDTALTLYDGHSNPIDFNSPWGGTNALVAADTLTGAYAPVSTSSLDSMLYLPVSTGSSNASVGGANGATGDAVIEVYDADPPPLVTKLVNISVRAPVGTGSDILFGGFVIGGTTDETVLIRALGPGLVAYFGTGVFTTAEVLAQPVLTVFAGSTPTGYTNTVWGGDQALVNAMTVTGAFPIPTTTQDSLLLITLPPGAYSAEVTGVNNTTGIAVVEVYEVF